MVAWIDTAFSCAFHKLYKINAVLSLPILEKQLPFKGNPFFLKSIMSISSNTYILSYLLSVFPNLNNSKRYNAAQILEENYIFFIYSRENMVLSRFTSLNKSNNHFKASCHPKSWHSLSYDDFLKINNLNICFSDTLNSRLNYLDRRTLSKIVTYIFVYKVRVFLCVALARIPQFDPKDHNNTIYYYIYICAYIYICDYDYTHTNIYEGIT